MTFGQQVLATLIGTVGGFILSIALFYIKECRVSKKNEKFIIDSARAEIDLGISILKRIKENISKAREKIEKNDINAYASIDYSGIARSFLTQLYISGLMNKKLKTDGTDKLNKIYISFSQGSSTYIQNALTKYRQNSISQREALVAVNYELGLIESSIKDLNNIKSKINL